MSMFLRVGAAVFLVALGYVLGASGLFAPARAAAQIVPPDQYAEPTQEKVKVAYDALASAMATLEQEGLYRPAIRGVNSFAVSTGGVDALRDLEIHQAVDPETFVGLYAGLANDEVGPHISFDEEGRLMYKNRVVRLYPISKTQSLIARRKVLAGIEEERVPLRP